MSTVLHLVGFTPSERAWIESLLGQGVEDVVFVDDADALLANVPSGPGHCLIATVDGDEEAATLRMVRRLRDSGVKLPVIVMGSHAEFRTAISMAKLGATDYLERPVSVRQLRARAPIDTRRPAPAQEQPLRNLQGPRAGLRRGRRYFPTKR